MIRVIGIGSDHGNDSIAWQLIENIKPQYSSHFDFICAQHNAMQLVNDIKGQDHVVLLDALLAEHSTGEISELNPDELQQDKHQPSSHGFSVANSLALAEQLDMLPKQLWLLGISVDQQTPLSKQQLKTSEYQLKQSLDKIIDLVQHSQS